MKNHHISNDLFHLIKPSTKTMEFDNVKFPKSIPPKDDVWK